MERRCRAEVRIADSEFPAWRNGTSTNARSVETGVGNMPIMNGHLAKLEE
jgi:hypothetical protein